MSNSPTSGVWDRCRQAAATPVDAASLGILRIGLYSVIVWEVWRYLSHGWVRDFYITPQFHFTYPGFHWIHPLPADGMYGVFIGLAVAAAFAALGVCYRLSAAVVWLLLSYVFLLEQTVYLNHLYLLVLITGLMMLIPADRAMCLVRPRREVPATVPFWAIWILRFQIAIPYVYGGLVKLNDDWLQGQPLQLWMAQMSQLKELIPGWGERPIAVVFCYAGLALDLFVVPLLLWQRTRWYALGVAIAFHFMNANMFHIGIFPWFMMIATTFFLDPNWPRQLLARLRRTMPVQTVSIGRSSPPVPNGLIIAGILWCLLQIVVPWRHVFIAGDVDWTEEGGKFAWRMMLHDKWSALGIQIVDPETGRARPFDPRGLLSRRQLDKMSYDPELLRTFAQFIADSIAQEGQPRPQVRMRVLCSLNGRRPEPLIDPTIDLAGEPWRWGHQSWIMARSEPLPDTPWVPPPELGGPRETLFRE